MTMLRELAEHQQATDERDQLLARRGSQLVHATLILDALFFSGPRLVLFVAVLQLGGALSVCMAPLLRGNVSVACWRVVESLRGTTLDQSRLPERFARLAHDARETSRQLVPRALTKLFYHWHWTKSSNRCRSRLLSRFFRWQEDPGEAADLRKGWAATGWAEPWVRAESDTEAGSGGVSGDSDLSRLPFALQAVYLRSRPLDSR